MALLNLDILPMTSSSLVNIALIDLSNLVMSLLAGTFSAPAFFVEGRKFIDFLLLILLVARNPNSWVFNLCIIAL